MRYEYWGDKINIYIHTEFNIAYKSKQNSKKEPDKTYNNLIHPSSYLREIIYPLLIKVFTASFSPLLKHQDYKSWEKI